MRKPTICLDCQQNPERNKKVEGAKIRTERDVGFSIDHFDRWAKLPGNYAVAMRAVSDIGLHAIRTLCSDVNNF